MSRQKVNNSYCNRNGDITIGLYLGNTQILTSKVTKLPSCNGGDDRTSIEVINNYGTNFSHTPTTSALQTHSLVSAGMTFNIVEETFPYADYREREYLIELVQGNHQVTVPINNAASAINFKVESVYYEVYNLSFATFYTSSDLSINNLIP